MITKNNCPLTSNQQKRADANQQIAKIKQTFPAGVGQSALRALAAAGYMHLNQLANAKESELKALHGMGPKALGALRAALEAKGKSFKQEKMQ